MQCTSKNKQTNFALKNEHFINKNIRTQPETKKKK